MIAGSPLSRGRAERSSGSISRNCANSQASERANKNRAIIHAHLPTLIAPPDAAEGVVTLNRLRRVAPAAIQHLAVTALALWALSVAALAQAPDATVPDAPVPDRPAPEAPVPKPEMRGNCPGLVAANRPALVPAAFRFAELKPDEVPLTFLGHSTFVIESPL